MRVRHDEASNLKSEGPSVRRLNSVKVKRRRPPQVVIALLTTLLYGKSWPFTDRQLTFRSRDGMSRVDLETPQAKVPIRSRHDMA